jgi:ABC-type branched-subunit amino acid transport system permease subunit
MFRFWGGYAIGYFNAKYFGSVYPEDFKIRFSLSMALIALCGGFISSLCGGIVSDYYEKRTYRIKAYVCM